MGNFLINQKIKKIKEIKDFDSFDYLINWDGVHTSYLNQGQRSTDKDLWKLIIMYTNGYNSISCFGWTLRSKIRRKSKKNQKIKIIKDFDSFDFLIYRDCAYTSCLSEGQCSTDRILMIIKSKIVHRQPDNQTTERNATLCI